MLPPMLLFALLHAARADDTFHPDASADLVSMADLVRTGTVEGRTGRVLVRTTDADALLALPEVAFARRLRGGLLSVTPAP